MKEVVLAFPDITSMAEYILVNRVSAVETDSKLVTIKGVLSDKEILKACQSYDAAIINSVGEEYED